MIASYSSTIAFVLGRGRLNAQRKGGRFQSLPFSCRVDLTTLMTREITTIDIETSILITKESKSIAEKGFLNGLRSILNSPWFSGNLRTRDKSNTCWKGTLPLLAWNCIKGRSKVWPWPQILTQKCSKFIWRNCWFSVRLLLLSPRNTSPSFLSSPTLWAGISPLPKFSSKIKKIKD